MRGALAFWRFFFSLVGGTLLLAVPVGIGALVGWFVAGKTETGLWAGFFVSVLLILVVLPTWALWGEGDGDRDRSST